MKKLFLGAMLISLGFTVNAQGNQFGLTGGFFNASAKIKFDGVSHTESEAGFYIGGLIDFSISEKFHIQPELVYVNVNDGSGIALPIIAKYYVSDGFNLQFGPHFDFSLEDVPNDFTGFGISLATGFGYDISDAFSMEARYAFQLNNYYTGDLNADLTTNSLMIGVSYKFSKK